MSLRFVCKGQIFVFVILAGCFGMSAIATAQQAAAPKKPAVAAPSSDSTSVATSVDPHREVRLHNGDVVEVKVFNVPELGGDTRVSADGRITLPLVGAVPVEGLTAAEAQNKIEARLRDGGFINDPHVSLFVKEFSTEGISVLGEVTKPGIYVLMGTRRLYDVLSVAGGITPRAGTRVTITRRDAPDTPIVVRVTTDPSRSLQSNIEVMPGDTVVVGRAGIVYVVGDVQRPAGFVMDVDEHLTVLQVMALAGGPNGTASLNKARIIRRGPDGSLKELSMPLKPILQAKGKDLPLQPDDILFVPASRAKKAASRSAEAVAQIATQVAIIRP